MTWWVIIITHRTRTYPATPPLPPLPRYSISPIGLEFKARHDDCSPAHQHPRCALSLPFSGLPLPCASASVVRLSPPLPLLLDVQHEAQHIEREFGILETHGPETALGFMPQHVGALPPERRHRLADGQVVRRGVAVHVTRVSNLGDGGGRDQMDLGMRQGFQALTNPVEISRSPPSASGTQQEPSRECSTYQPRYTLWHASRAGRPCRQWPGWPGRPPMFLNRFDEGSIPPYKDTRENS